MFEILRLSAARLLARAVLVLGLLVTSSTALSAQAVASASPAPPLVLRPGDAVRLEVRDEARFTNDYSIDGDGMVLLPMIGLVKVAGRPFPDVQREVLASFAHEMPNPELRLTAILRIAVLGEVNQPGLLPVDATYSLADVVARAGGLTPSANRSAISLVRDGARFLTTSAEELPLLRVGMLSGDQVFVARRSWMQENVPIVVGGAVSVLAALVTALVLR